MWKVAAIKSRDEIVCYSRTTTATAHPAPCLFQRVTAVTVQDTARRCDSWTSAHCHSSRVAAVAPAETPEGTKWRSKGQPGQVTED